MTDQLVKIIARFVDGKTLQPVAGDEYEAVLMDKDWAGDDFLTGLPQTQMGWST